MVFVLTVEVQKDGLTRYRTYIMLNKKQYSLGVYDTLDQAIEVRKKAEKEFNKLIDEKRKNRIKGE